MIDTYSKIVLTVIAGALLVLVTQQLTSSARASFGTCGETQLRPCYMVVKQSTGVL